MVGIDKYNGRYKIKYFYVYFRPNEEDVRMMNRTGNYTLKVQPERQFSKEALDGIFKLF